MCIVKLSEGQSSIVMISTSGFNYVKIMHTLSIAPCGHQGKRAKRCDVAGSETRGYAIL